MVQYGSCCQRNVINVKVEMHQEERCAHSTTGTASARMTCVHMYGTKLTGLCIFFFISPSPCFNTRCQYEPQKRCRDEQVIRSGPAVGEAGSIDALEAWARPYFERGTSPRASSHESSFWLTFTPREVPHISNRSVCVMALENFVLISEGTCDFSLLSQPEHLYSSG